ncbi:septal ring lytic transglycosylase RlpA family protein [Vulgatibacter sp.]|uniref:septal ring lytic transglycosylase RlpA family protein n=1 Tax=Vulgatibacter sp. TaxID=1971226 RepID=UPI00356597B2
MRRLLPFLFALSLASACATTRQETAGSGATPARKSPWQEGIASYYADSLHGRKTASGQPYDREAATCAHRTHRFGTELVVQVVDTGQTTMCRVNDRGPFVRGRIVDLSKRLARELGLLERGLVRVRIAPRDAVE